jgi:hypothetical protein
LFFLEKIHYHTKRGTSIGESMFKKIKKWLKENKKVLVSDIQGSYADRKVTFARVKYKNLSTSEKKGYEAVDYYLKGIPYEKSNGDQIE